jgi:DinB family protein
MPIIPDTKNWTWVLETPCEECGYDARDYPDAAIAPAIRRSAEPWQEVLARPNLRDRPDDATWSPLEYGSHVRDVFRTSERRVHLMLDEEDPQFENWDQDATAIADRYDEQDPQIVLDELADAASALARTYESLEDSQWQRSGRRSDGAQFTVSSLGRYTLHDVVHHVWDVTR